MNYACVNMVLLAYPTKRIHNFVQNQSAMGRKTIDPNQWLPTILDVLKRNVLGIWPGLKTIETICLPLYFCVTRYSKMQTITKEKMEKLQSEGIDVSVTASFSLVGKVDASVSTSVSKSKEEMEKFENSLEETREVTFGSKPPSDGKFVFHLF